MAGSTVENDTDLAGRHVTAAAHTGAHAAVCLDASDDAEFKAPPGKRAQKGGGAMQQGAPAKKTMKGKAICADLNVGQCKQGPRCQRGLHICNWTYATG